MTAPATAERTRAAAGTTPANLKEAAPDELKVEGAADDALEVPAVEAAEGVVTGVVAVTEGVETVPVDLRAFSMMT